MEHRFNTGYFFLEDFQHIAMSIAVVNDDGQTKLFSNIDLFQENSLLYFFRFVFLPVVVKANFANGNYFRVHCPRRQHIQIIFGHTFQIFRMPTYCGVDEVIFFCQLYGKSASFRITTRVNDTVKLRLQIGDKLVPVAGKVVRV